MSNRTVTLPNGEPCEVTEIAPGEWAPVLKPGAPLPLYGYLYLVSDGNGKFIPRVRMWTQRVKLGETTIRDLGLGDLHPKILRRLGAAGLIDVSEISPGTRMLDVASLINHLEAARDPEYWTPRRRQAYRDAVADIK